MVPLADTALCKHQCQLVLAQLPALLLTLTTWGASQIANSLGKVVQQLQGVCQVTTNRSDASANKTHHDHYGPTLDIWMQLSHVASEANLQPVHMALAVKRQEANTFHLGAACQPSSDD
jgi:hypothetical protein